MFTFQAYSILPERPFGNPPPLWEDVSINREVATDEPENEVTTEGPDSGEVATTAEPVETEESNKNSNEETMIKVETKSDNASLVKLCIGRYILTEILLG